MFLHHACESEYQCKENVDQEFQYEYEFNVWKRVPS